MAVTVDVALVSETTSLTGNWGCRATTLALADLVAEVGGRVSGVVPALDIEVGPAVRRLAAVARGLQAVRAPQRTSTQFDPPLALPDLRRSGGRFHRIEQLGGRIDARALPTPTSASDLESAVDALELSSAWAHHLDVLRAADVVLVNGEGSIYAGQAKGARLLALCHLAATRLHKPVALVNQTVHAEAPADRSLLEAVLPGLQDVSFREPLSAEAWGHLVPAGRKALVPDAAFRWEPLAADAFWAGAHRADHFATWPDRCPPLEPGYACVGGSSALLRAADKRFDPAPGYLALCRALLAAGRQVVLTSSDRTDEVFLRPIAQQLGLPHVGVPLPIPQATDILAHAAVVVTGRWHPSILAASGGTPVVGLGANSYKTEGFQQLMGQPPWVHDARLSPDGAERLAAEAIALAGDAGRPTRQAVRDDLRDQTVGLVRLVAEHAGRAA